MTTLALHRKLIEIFGTRIKTENLKFYVVSQEVEPDRSLIQRSFYFEKDLLQAIANVEENEEQHFTFDFFVYHMYGQTPSLVFVATPGMMSWFWNAYKDAGLESSISNNLLQIPINRIFSYFPKQDVIVADFFEIHEDE